LHKNTGEKGGSHWIGLKLDGMAAPLADRSWRPVGVAVGKAMEADTELWGAWYPIHRILAREYGKEDDCCRENRASEALKAFDEM